MTVSATNKSATELASDARPAWYGYLLNQAALKIRTATGDALASFGITPPQLRALEAIADSEPLTQVRLGELVNMDRSTIVHLLDRFEALALAERNIDPADRRSHAVRITRKGRRVLGAARARTLAIQEDFLGRLTRTERETLRTLLVKLVDPTPCPKESDDESSPSPPDA